MVENLGCYNGGRVQCNLVDDYDSFLEDYSILGDFYANFNVQEVRNIKSNVYGKINLW